jgi:hypothetical protein
MSKKIDIVTSFAFFDSVDIIPIQKALKSHIDNNLVSNVYILTESRESVVKNNFSFTNNDKVIIVETENRPTFGELIEFVNSLFRTNSDNLVALMNGDVSFENKESIVKTSNAFKSNNIKPNTIFALSRHELINEKLEIYLELDNSLPNYISADAWIFPGPCIINQDLFYFMGQMNCDLMLAYDLKHAGYDLYNPCLDIKIIHHEDELKPDTFYEGENNKQKTKDAMFKFMASRANLNYTVVALPWMSSKWFDYNYTPVNYKFNNVPTIWLAIKDRQITNLIDVVKALEALSSAKNFQLNLVFENQISDENVCSFEEISALTNNVYFHSVKSINRFVEMALQGKVTWSKSFALINDTSRITSSLLSNIDELIVVLNDNRTAFNFCGPDILGIDLKWCLSERYNSDFSDIIDYELYNKRRCSLVTSMFRTDEFIQTFIKNCRNLYDYSNIDHFYVLSNLSDVEKACISHIIDCDKNSIIIWHRQDPGLYECWNVGIRCASTVYVSNANVDDLRDSAHISTLIGQLDSMPKYSFGATALFPFEEFSGDLASHQKGTPWYSDYEQDIDFESLAFVEEKDDGTLTLNPHNIPHCMPVWRRDLHHKFGYFNEITYGTFADWAFWLKITREGEIGKVVPEGLGFYYVNLESHNRRGDKLTTFHNKVEQDFLPYFLNKKTSSQTQKLDRHTCKQKLKIWGSDLYYGDHRNSFNKIAEALLPLETSNEGILLLPFIERYFVWGNEPGEAGSATPCPIQKPWVGILHVPFFAPSWFHSHVSPEVIFEKDLWQKSLPYCKGIITLSGDLKRDVEYHLPNIPVLSLLHPTDFDNLKAFDFERYTNKPTLVQAGDWLRKLQAIHQIKANGHRRVMLKKAYTNSYLANEIAEFGDVTDPSVEIFTMVSNEEYDDLLSSSVVVCWLYATAANNLVLECIARKTPLLINPLPSVVEYLGLDYPLYINDIAEAEALLADKQRIKTAHDYLKNSKFRTELSYQAFFEKFRDSDFYNNL